MCKANHSGLHPKLCLCQKWVIFVLSGHSTELMFLPLCWAAHGAAGGAPQLPGPTTCGWEAQGSCAQPVGVLKKLMIYELRRFAGYVMGSTCTPSRTGTTEGGICLRAPACSIKQGWPPGKGMAEETEVGVAAHGQPLIPTWGCRGDLLLFCSWVKTTAFRLPLLQTSHQWLCRCGGFWTSPDRQETPATLEWFPLRRVSDGTDVDHDFPHPVAIAVSFIATQFSSHRSDIPLDLAWSY